MKIGQLQFKFPGMDDIEARDIELTVDEFKDLTNLLKLINNTQAELERLRSKDRP